jgi:CheY-like chemotaxis protein
VVVVATSGEEAIEALAAEPFDLLLSDVGMGAGMNGWELAGLARRGWPDLPIVLATGWGAAIDPDDARAKGVAAVLAKPYLPEDLRQVVNAVCQPPKLAEAPPSTGSAAPVMKAASSEWRNRAA